MKKTLKSYICRIKGLARVAGIVSAGLLAGGCPSDKPAPATPVVLDSNGKIVIRGSNTIGEELAPSLIAEYKKDHPAAAFDVETKATGYGLASLRAGRCDIAGASREANKEEIAEAQTYHMQMNDHIIGSYSVAVTVNANNPVANLTKQQVMGIFTGSIKNWKDVGGPDSEIHLYIRDPISGTYLGFRELAMDNKPYDLGAKLETNYAAIVDAVAQDANGIGYSSMDLASKAGVKGLTIDGASPTAEVVNKGKYPYMRTLHLYTNKARESGGVHDFIEYIESPKGQKVLAQVGFVPHP